MPDPGPQCRGSLREPLLLQRAYMSQNAPSCHFPRPLWVSKDPEDGLGSPAPRAGVATKIHEPRHGCWTPAEGAERGSVSFKKSWEKPWIAKQLAQYGHRRAQGSAPAMAGQKMAARCLTLRCPHRLLQPRCLPRATPPRASRKSWRQGSMGQTLSPQKGLPPHPENRLNRMPCGGAWKPSGKSATLAPIPPGRR